MGFLVAVLLVSLAASGVVVAQDDETTLSEEEQKDKIKNQFSELADLIILVIVAVAVPNGRTASSSG